MVNGFKIEVRVDSQLLSTKSRPGLINRHETASETVATHFLQNQVDKSRNSNVLVIAATHNLQSQWQVNKLETGLIIAETHPL